MDRSIPQRGQADFTDCLKRYALQYGEGQYIYEYLSDFVDKEVKVVFSVERL